MPTTRTDAAATCIRAARKLSQEVSQLDFSACVPWVYNPLDYAWAAHEQYLTKAARSSCRVIFLGMNPGPWGMAQTGVPFGELAAARDWLGIDAPIRKPQHEHPKRPIEGWACKRSEVSGRRLWGLFAERCNSADEFFDEHFVANYCPLVFMEESARNVTPDKLPAAAREPLEAACDAHLAKLIQQLAPQWVIGVGAWAEGLAKRVIEQHQIPGVQTGRILHPSPASPAANKGWAAIATKQLLQMKVWLE
jgi:single-strand selective monofunctional uracil DNA glycosylase